MGRDTFAVLPHNARAVDVSKVAGKLAGHESYSSRCGTLIVKNSVVRSVHTNTPGIVAIEVDNWPMMYYNYEPTIAFPGRRLAIGSSTGKSIAMGKALIKFFGGTLVYDDYDQDHYAITPWEPDLENCPDDGPHFVALQQRIASLVPLAEADFLAVEKFAAYKVVRR